MNWEKVIAELRRVQPVVYPYHKEAYEVIRALADALEEGLEKKK